MRIKKKELIKVLLGVSFIQPPTGSENSQPPGTKRSTIANCARYKESHIKLNLDNIEPKFDASGVDEAKPL
jgi:hypothetical protein